jgi:hypothetical protein
MAELGATVTVALGHGEPGTDAVVTGTFTPADLHDQLTGE